MNQKFTLFSVFLIALFAACKKDDTPSSGSTAPMIKSFTPASGPVGTTVTISGSSFDKNPSLDVVKFNDIKATVSAASDSQLVVTVPDLATTGKISVTINGQSVSSSSDFTVTVAPVISSFSPVIGLAGDTIIISGSNFSSTLTDNIVKFGGNATASVISANATQIKVKVPAGATTGKISVTIGNLQANSTTSFEVLADIPRSGLICYYPFSNNVNDASGNGFNLTLYTGTDSVYSDRFGVANRAYYFVGGNGQAYSSSNTAAQVSQPLTIAAWIKYDNLISSSIVSKYYPTGYIFGVSSAGQLYTVIDGGKYVYSNNGVLPTTTNEWIFIAMSYDGTTMKFYKDGASAGSPAFTGTITSNASTNSFRIGLDGNTIGPNVFRCAIDDVTVYNRVLSDAEILQLKQQTVSKK
ncbi:hypothetical protein A3860_32460 [Niastella vici]|uniref:LamG-like jellyroll fold domain-containing protein n=1 Tax=Niastella vici TaxID=1703345 RepID=A0A1V9FQT9_9BACT|nr:IPT/TIG domain-containing protein [Niastella vici]OQP60713.1 hypothetical protein A3860_32460 [Niastella vici]